MGKLAAGGTSSKTIMHLMALFLLFIFSDLLSSLPFDLLFLFINLPERWMYFVLRSLGSLGLTWMLFWLYTKFVFRMKMSDFGITFDWNGYDMVYAVSLPIFVVLAFMLAGSVSFNTDITSQDRIGILSDGLTRAFRAGILEEILFRGYFLQLLRQKWGWTTAIILPSFVFSLGHIGSIEPFNVLGVLLVIAGGTLFGAMLSLVAAKDGSICGSVLIHIIWNFVIASDLLHISPNGEAGNTSIFFIHLSSSSPLLTENGLGVETSVIALVGYLFVLLLVLGSSKLYGNSVHNR